MTYIYSLFTSGTHFSFLYNLFSVLKLFFLIMYYKFDVTTLRHDKASPQVEYRKDKYNKQLILL